MKSQKARFIVESEKQVVDRRVLEGRHAMLVLRQGRRFIISEGGRLAMMPGR